MLGRLFFFSLYTEFNRYSKRTNEVYKAPQNDFQVVFNTFPIFVIFFVHLMTEIFALHKINQEKGEFTAYRDATECIEIKNSKRANSIIRKSQIKYKRHVMNICYFTKNLFDILDILRQIYGFFVFRFAVVSLNFTLL